MTDFIEKDDINYPELLRNITSPPKKLYYKGDINLLKTPSLAVVGSRDLTEYGRHIEKIFVNHVARRRVTIVSGLARGADSVAHKETLDVGGKTIGVLGGGFGNVSMLNDIKLYERIINEGGLVISEYEDNIPFLSKNFPVRNRIIAGLALGTLVVEAKHRSGSGITAKFSKKFGRKTFALPRKT